MLCAKRDFRCSKLLTFWLSETIAQEIQAIPGYIYSRCNLDVFFGKIKYCSRIVAIYFTQRHRYSFVLGTMKADAATARKALTRSLFQRWKTFSYGLGFTLTVAQGVASKMLDRADQPLKDRLVFVCHFLCSVLPGHFAWTHDRRASQRNTFQYGTSSRTADILPFSSFYGQKISWHTHTWHWADWLG